MILSPYYSSILCFMAKKLMKFAFCQTSQQFNVIITLLYQLKYIDVGNGEYIIQGNFGALIMSCF